MKQNPLRSSLGFYALPLAAFFGLGLSMPSCPGQQAMQQQVDTLTAQNQELNKRTLAFDAQIKALNTDMVQVKTLLKPMADAIQAQKAAMDQLNANLHEIQTKMTAPAKGGAAKKKK